MQHPADVPVFPELSPDAAPPQIRAIYDEICHWAAVPMAALIFRNLATHPGVLEEVWDGMGPLFHSGQIQDAVKIAITLVLHTWGSALMHRPHVHMIAPGGGISPDGTRWISGSAKFLVLFIGAMVAITMARRR
jgi:hypothetical protein